MKKIISFILIILFINTEIAANAAFWKKGDAIGNEIKQEEFPESKEVEPKIDNSNDVQMIKGGVENTLDVNLEDCLKYALGNNPRIQAAMQDVFASDARLRQVWSSYFPQFSWQSGYSRIKQLQLSDVFRENLIYNYWVLGQISASQMLYDFGVTQNQATISPEKWDSLSIDEQIAFVRLKINESKILHDKDAFDYWNANLGSLEAKKTQTSIIDDKLAEKPPERPVENKSDSLDFSVMINQLRTQNSQISSEYKSMLSDGYIDDEELAILISRLKDLSDNASVIKSMVTDQNQEIMIDSIIEMINKESIKMTTMQRGIEETNHSFGR